MTAVSCIVTELFSLLLLDINAPVSVHNFCSLGAYTVSFYVCKEGNKHERKILVTHDSRPYHSVDRSCVPGYQKCIYNFNMGIRLQQHLPCAPYRFDHSILFCPQALCRKIKRQKAHYIALTTKMLRIIMMREHFLSEIEREHPGPVAVSPSLIWE